MNQLRNKKSDPVIRMTFSMPKEVVGEIDAQRHRLAATGKLLNKSEVLRLGLALLSDLPINKIDKVLKKIDRLKAGRPKFN